MVMYQQIKRIRSWTSLEKKIIALIMTKCTYDGMLLHFQLQQKYIIYFGFILGPNDHEKPSFRLKRLIL